MEPLPGVLRSRAWLRPGPLAAVAAGGTLGTAARAGADAWVGAPGPWPTSTFVINVVGSLALGALLGRLAGGNGRAAGLRLLAGTGFLGAFTTYSAFAVEVAELAAGGRAPLALAYAGASLALGLLAAAAGGALAAPRRRGRRVDPDDGAVP
ncbi:fluoride efflux transporter FluC [Georgenia wangjunii]|uniref:fluoride efflux transporter FluC n=1 Tax=Georgenia wangjunii TaxID=3117730 RepID=UPI002F25FF20